MSSDIETVKIMVKVKTLSPLLAIIINVMKLIRTDKEEIKDHRILIDKQITKEMGTYIQFKNKMETPKRRSKSSR